MDWFKPKPTLKEEQKNNDKALRKVSRDVTRDRRTLEREEKNLELELKKYAKEGNREGCRILAKQLVNLRKQKNRMYQMDSKIHGVKFQNRVMGANASMATAMSGAAKSMGQMNNLMKPEKLASNMKAFQMANDRMEMSEELINDTLDDILNDSGDEEATDNVVKQVLDEIGIEISGKMLSAPSANRSRLPGESSRDKLPSSEEIEQQLAKLRS